VANQKHRKFWLPNNITFAVPTEADLPYFCQLHDLVMRDQVARQNLQWNQAHEDVQNREFFNIAGLRRILLNGKLIGFIGIHSDAGKLMLSRFYLEPSHQNKGLGTCILEIIFAEQQCQRQTISLRVLNKSPARSLYERFGFRLTGEDEIFAYYQR
jgi:RimJ/RimL family protein N-acetyltransferase